MLSGRLSALAARTRQVDLMHAAEARRGRSAHRVTPVTRVTLRYASAADADRLRALRELDSCCDAAPAFPGERALVAEVDGRLRAALPLDGGAPFADPFYRGGELLELLRLRARQLAH